ncbi:MAG: hypothetical protein NC218_10535 [Acetobacter sp.]|nr:hypothetical protein [Acetobacter sp.]
MTNGVAIRGMTQKEESMDLFLLICHRSERSEVKRSRESIDYHVANAPRNDEVRDA